MLSLPLVLSKFAMIRITDCVDIYAILRRDRMHALSLGIRSMMKECTTSMIEDSTKTSSALGTTASVPRSFAALARTVLAWLDRFLQSTQKKSDGFGPRIYFSKCKAGATVSGQFNENSLFGMLKMHDSQAIDNVSPLLVAFVDQFCGNHDAQITRIYTEYVDVVNFMVG